MKNILIALSLIVVMTSCVEVLFEQTQPAGVKEIQQFPKALLGMYIEETENDTLRITPFELQGPKNERDSAMKISPNFVLKKFKNEYVISRKHDSGLWEVAFISISKKGQLEIKTIDGGDEEKMKRLKLLLEVTTKYDEEGKADQYILNPTKKEFFKILKADIFEELGVFKKMN